VPLSVPVDVLNVSPATEVIYVPGVLAALKVKVGDVQEPETVADVEAEVLITATMSVIGVLCE
jgi:hypothetical protein